MRTRIAGLIATLVFAYTAVADAHEIGKTQVTAVVDPASGIYQFDVVVDPDALLTRLQIRATGDVEEPRDREERDRRIAALGQSFLDSVRVKFDGILVEPQFAYR